MTISRRQFFVGATGGVAAGLGGAGRAWAQDRATGENGQTSYRVGELIYQNALARPEDIDGFRMEGPGVVSFPRGRMRMESGVDIDVTDPADSQAANIVHWCPTQFPPSIEIAWDFWPIREPGLCILFFAALGQGGESVFDKALAPRTGPYNQYHHGDINALHVSYFRRRALSERAFHTCNLRKSHGFHLVATGADPIPSVADAKGPYRIRVVKCEGLVQFFINDLLLLDWTDDGETHGPILGAGQIGFRQMAPLIGEYANLAVRLVRPTKR